MCRSALKRNQKRKREGESLEEQRSTKEKEEIFWRMQRSLEDG
jgi:hypothetical protein